LTIVGRTSRDWRSRAPWALPCAIAVVVFFMTATGISGTSLPLLSKDGGGGDSVIVGTPRPVRSDEWLIRTPLLLAQKENGFPRFAEIGVGEHDMSVLADLPVADWPAFFKPHQWGFFALPIANGFAFEWWSSAAVLILGAYLFLLTVTRSLKWALVGSAAVYASPYFHWWYAPTTFAVPGWALVGAATFVLSMDEDRGTRSRVMLVLASAFAVVCFGLLLYPPWQIPILLAVGIMTVGTLWTRSGSGVRAARRMVATSLGVVGTALVPLIAYWLSRRGVFEAIASTVYPGSRASAGGGLPVVNLSSSWFGWTFVRNERAFPTTVYPNVSEASSFFPVGVMLVVALPLVWRFVAPIGGRLRGPIIGCLAAMALLLVHAFVGLPSLLARLTGLSTVPVGRSIVGLGIASLVLLVIVGLVVERASIPVRARILAGAVLVVVTVTSVITVLQQVHEAGSPLSWRGALIALLAAFTCSAAYFWRPFLAVLGLVLFGLTVSLPANPLVRGVSQVTDSELASEVHRLMAEGGPESIWMSESITASGVITAAGAANLSGINLYPNSSAWEILDPSRSSEPIWNRYAHTRWTFDGSALQPRLTLVQSDVIAIRVSPCATELDRLNVRWIVTAREIDGACLRPMPSVRGPEGTLLRVYERILDQPDRNGDPVAT